MNRPAWEAALSNEASTLARVDALAPLSTTPHHAAGPARLTASTVANRPQSGVIHSVQPPLVTDGYVPLCFHPVIESVSAAISRLGCRGVIRTIFGNRGKSRTDSALCADRFRLEEGADGDGEPIALLCDESTPSAACAEISPAGEEEIRLRGEGVNRNNDKTEADFDENVITQKVQGAVEVTTNSGA